MPIYAYKCGECGHAADVLQKMSDPVLTQCPQCGSTSYAKQITAAGFQLKGSGWYVTDFRNGSGGGAAKTTAASESSGGSVSSDAPAASGSAPAAAAT